MNLEIFHTEHSHTMGAQRGLSLILMITTCLVNVTCAVSPGGILALKALGTLGPFLSSLLSGGLHEIILSTGDDNKIDTVLEKLNEIKRELEQVQSSIEELKALSTRTQAEAIERKLMGYFRQLMTITEAVKTYHDNKIKHGYNDTEQTLQDNINAFKNDLQKVPLLLTEYHIVIIGGSVSSGGSSPGLACDFIDYITSKGICDVKRLLEEESEFRDPLMKLQVQSFHMYKSTCKNHDLVCDHIGKDLETNLEVQEKRFRKCLLDKFEPNSKNQKACCPAPSAAAMLSVNCCLAPLVILIIERSTHRLL